jgi:hypothetical protein
MTNAIDLMKDALPKFYDVFKNGNVAIESPDGETKLENIPAIFSFGEGPEYQGADAPGTEGKVRFMVSDVATVSAGYTIYRGEEQWRVLGGSQKTSDDLEWIVPISRRTV